MDIRLEIKKILLENGMTLTDLAKQIGEEKQTDYSLQNLSSKLRRGTINFNELQIIAKILGFKIKFEMEMPDR